MNRTHIGPYRIDGKQGERRLAIFDDSRECAEYLGQTVTEYTFAALERENRRVKRLKHKEAEA